MTCIICGSAENLNTSMGINVEGQTINVAVCDEHAEDCTPGKARAAYSERQAQIAALMAQAKALGVSLAPVAPAAKPALVAQPIQEAKAQPQLEGFVKTGPRRRASQPSANIVSEVGGLESHSGFTLDGIDIPEEALEGVAQFARVEGRNGQMIELPSVQRDGLGETRIVISKSGGDAELQDSFKAISHMTIKEGRDVGFGTGYHVTTCSLCKGRLMITHNKALIKCPKCQGRG